MFLRGRQRGGIRNHTGLQVGIVGAQKLAAPGHRVLATAFWPCQNRVVPYGQLPRWKAPVAQLDRATVYGTVGYTFEPCRVHASA